MLTVDTWIPGSTILFGAKVSVDDDITDASAVMKKKFTDDDIDSTDAEYVYYTLKIDPDETTVEPRNYIGEFQFVDPDGRPTTYEQFDISVIADINRRVA